MSNLIKNKCLECGGSGSVDSGGFTPWGTSIDVACGVCDGTGTVLVPDQSQPEEDDGP